MRKFHLKLKVKSLKLILRVLACLFLLIGGSFLLAQTEDKSLTLPLGPSKYRGKFLQIAPGQLYSARSGRLVDFAHMIKEMRKARFIYLGETHDDLEIHDWQLRIIKALYEQDPNLAIGVEQITVDLQPVLNSWSAGELDEETFLQRLRWYLIWNFNYRYYQQIFDFARQKKIPVLALNVPRNLINKVRMQGYEALSEEEKQLIPSLDLSKVEHRLLIRTIFESEEIPPKMKGNNLEQVFEALYRAQVAWDETMAQNVVKAAEATGRRMIVLAGSGHLLYNLGINLRVSGLKLQPSATVVGFQVPEGGRLKLSRGLADFIYGVREKIYPAYPAIGLDLKKVEGLENLVVGASPVEPLAASAGFQKGDVILSVENRAFDQLHDLRLFLSK
ncbi:MAG: ChaN family lipoprotein, partial [Candidatus Saccharicenans sp.]